LTIAVSSTYSNNQTVTWESLTPNVATVSSLTGEVTRLTKGTASIRATARENGCPFYASYTLTIMEIPFSGWEIPYDPAIWNDNGVYRYTNCYAYALNNQYDPINSDFGCNYTDLDPKQQPGEFYNANKTDIESAVSTLGYEDDTSLLVSAVQKDYEMYNRLFGTNLIFEPIEKNEICPDGTYKVALFVKPSSLLSPADYHWYRQDPDGQWSHKRGTNFVKRVDDSLPANEITDPEYAAETAGYTIFGGYFAVSPWNNIWSNATGSSVEYEANNICTNANATISQEQASCIELGMTIDEVVNVLGFVGEDIGSGSIIYKYSVENGEDLIIACSMDSTGVFIVTHIINSENTEV
jgi:hypothetical protein